MLSFELNELIEFTIQQQERLKPPQMTLTRLRMLFPHMVDETAQL